MQEKQGVQNGPVVVSRSKYPFAETVQRLQETAKGLGWGLPMTHDIQKTIKEKSGRAVEAVTVIELCKPSHSADLLEKPETRMMAAFMPCRIAVIDMGDGIAVGRMNAAPMLAAFGGDAAKVMGQAAAEIEDIIKKAVG
jgi:uncharacterized protein (DUF302 family)